MKITPLQLLVVVSVGPFLVGVGCSMGDEKIGHSSGMLISPAATNYSVTGTDYGNHEEDVAFASGQQVGQPAGSAQGNWSIGFNAFVGDDTKFAGFSYSTDANGTSWTPSSIASGTAWGNPGNSPYDGAAFLGWRGDPSMIAVTDPTLNNSARRLLYSMIAVTGTAVNHEINDVIVALSDDGGHTWANTSYVNGDSSHGGGGTDNPYMAANPVSPYHSFIAWDAQDNTSWLAQIQFSTGTPPALTVSNYTTIPTPVDVSVHHPRIAVGQYIGCNGSAHEAVFVSYAAAGERCGFDGTAEVTPNAWYLALYDVVSSSWLGPWELYGTDSSWPNCVGGGSPDFGVSNDARAPIAVDATTDDGYFYVAHTISGAHGTRYDVDYGVIGCSNSQTTPTVNHQVGPDPCDASPFTGLCTFGDGGTGGPDGGPLVQDQWGPTVNFTYLPGSPATPRVLVSWYDTRDDTSDVNVDIWMQYSEDHGSSWSSVTKVSVAGAGQTVPWDYHLGGWDDYQGLGVNNLYGTFLNAWGADCRLGSGECGIWSSLLQ